MCITGRVFMQRRHNGRRHRHQHQHDHEEEDNDPVSKNPVAYNFTVFTYDLPKMSAVDVTTNVHCVDSTFKFCPLCLQYMYMYFQI